MRITNNMILNTSASNINDVKGTLDKKNTQMTNQQKINRPSEDPVIAVRSLRLETTYSKTEQYYRKNIPDAESWLDVTETALLTMKDIITSFRTLAVNGATGTLTQDDRNTILTQLKSLQSELFTTANADYAGRTVFTGYRTDKKMTFMGNETDTAYTIRQQIPAEEILSSRYYSNEVPMPTNPGEVLALTDAERTGDYNTRETNFYRMRLAYNDINGATGDATATPPIADWDPINSLKISYKTIDGTVPGATALIDKDGNPVVDDWGNQIYEVEITPANVHIFDSEDDWEKADLDSDPNMPGIKKVPADDIVIIKGTGDVIFGDKLAYEIQSNKATMDITYTKTGFLTSELRPEYYFDCTNVTDPLKQIDYLKYEEDGSNMPYDINYTIAENQTIKVNLEAADVFDHKPYQDMSDMINAVTYAIEAHDKLGKIGNMMSDPKYADPDTQAKLAQWKEIIQKECDYADDNMDKLYTEELKYADKYLADLNLNITRLGCTVDQLKMTEKRMSEYEENVLSLQSENDNVDLSQVLIDYTSIYTAYQSSLTAAGKLYQQTLLNYI